MTNGRSGRRRRGGHQLPRARRRRRRSVRRRRGRERVADALADRLRRAGLVLAGCTLPGWRPVADRSVAPGRAPSCSSSTTASRAAHRPPRAAGRARRGAARRQLARGLALRRRRAGRAAAGAAKAAAGLDDRYEPPAAGRARAARRGSSRRTTAARTRSWSRARRPRRRRCSACYRRIFELRPQPAASSLWRVRVGDDLVERHVDGEPAGVAAIAPLVDALFAPAGEPGDEPLPDDPDAPLLVEIEWTRRRDAHRDDARLRRRPQRQRQGRGGGGAAPLHGGRGAGDRGRRRAGRLGVAARPALAGLATAAGDVLAAAERVGPQVAVLAHPLEHLVGAEHQQLGIARRPQPPRPPPTRAGWRRSARRPWPAGSRRRRSSWRCGSASSRPAPCRRGWPSSAPSPRRRDARAAGARRRRSRTRGRAPSRRSGRAAPARAGPCRRWS